ncbi:MAG: hypothetical protein ABS37_14090 [Acidovorax sp. SCN 65-108]|nr:hypothetical protein AE621_09550 [Acidovorax sp. SD340]ODS61797.1 MAG: hypothetical protein ABS37_14090 [Acidovorax sp. SCN 65-108]OJV73831.1 MAG: hypothetical protein BGO35_02150 [Burkholderiales bacterium 64-34]
MTHDKDLQARPKTGARACAVVVTGQRLFPSFPHCRALAWGRLPAPKRQHNNPAGAQWQSPASY